MKQKRFIHTNHLGAFSSQRFDLGNERMEDSCYMVTLDNPTKRINIISSFSITLKIDGFLYHLDSKEFLDSSLSYDNHQLEFDHDFSYYPNLRFKNELFEFEFKRCYLKKTNDIAFSFTLVNKTKKEIELIIEPNHANRWVHQNILLDYSYQDQVIKLGDYQVYLKTDLNIKLTNKVKKDCLYRIDQQDERTYKSDEYVNYYFVEKVEGNRTLTKSLKYYFNHDNFNGLDYFKTEETRIDHILSTTFIKSSFGKDLLIASEDYYAKRDESLTLIAGYPFFNDWGRDTMISMVGTFIYPRKFKEAKEVFNTFLNHLKDGLLPNCFPSGDLKALYNTVDASLLLFESLYLYYQESNDLEFIKEVLPKLSEILDYYIKGTRYNIFMDDDYLLVAGKDNYQLTWMDVLVDGILPTKRQGKAIEINALWYNAFMIYDSFLKLLELPNPYATYQEKIKESFKKFDNDIFIKDYLSPENDVFKEDQIRPNALLALSYSFKVIGREKALKLFEVTKDKLITSHGLRSLAYDDREFQSSCFGPMLKRDLSYHQGTVWPFLTPAYYLAYLSYHDYSKEAVSYLLDELKKFEMMFYNDTYKQIAEIYDGLNPSVPRGCYAQNWSVSEVLKLIIILEKRGIIYENN